MFEISDILGHPGRLITSSKGRYAWDNPNDLTVFNSNIMQDSEKLWYGDLNLSCSQDIQKLKFIAATLGKNIKVTGETENVVMTIEPEGTLILEDTIAGAYKLTTGVPTLMGAERDDGCNELDVDLLIAPNASILEFEEGLIKIEVANDFYLFIANSEEPPYVTFFQYVATYLGIEIKDIDVSKVIVSECVELCLNQSLIDYLVGQYGTDHYSIHKNYLWLHFQYGPNVGDWKDMGDNVIYVRGGKNEAS